MFLFTDLTLPTLSHILLMSHYFLCHTVFCSHCFRFMSLKDKAVLNQIYSASRDTYCSFLSVEGRCFCAFWTLVSQGTFHWCVCCNKKLFPVATKLEINSPKQSVRSLSDRLEVERKARTETSETWRPLYSRFIAKEWAGKGERHLEVQAWVSRCCTPLPTLFPIGNILAVFIQTTHFFTYLVFVQNSHSRWLSQALMQRVRFLLSFPNWPLSAFLKITNRHQVAWHIWIV